MPANTTQTAGDTEAIGSEISEGRTFDLLDYKSRLKGEIPQYIRDHRMKILKISLSHGSFSFNFIWN